MELAFFGLSLSSAPQFRINLFKQIHEIVFHGNGGYTWESVYNMPTWLRKYTYHELVNHYKNKNDNPTENTAISADGTIKKPDVFQTQTIQAGPKSVSTPKNRPITYK